MSKKSGEGLFPDCKENKNPGEIFKNYFFFLEIQLFYFKLCLRFPRCKKLRQTRFNISGNML